MRIKATIVLEYEADPAHYGTGDPQEMVQMDVSGDLVALVATADSCTITGAAVAPTTTGGSD